MRDGYPLRLVLCFVLCRAQYDVLSRLYWVRATCALSLSIQSALFFVHLKTGDFHVAAISC